MPIKPENRARYPKDWAEISRAAKERAGWKCQHPGCTAQQYSIVLTAAHLNHQPEDCRPENLAAMCQRHHLAYDAKHHAQTAYATRKARAGTADLFG